MNKINKDIIVTEKKYIEELRKLPKNSDTEFVCEKCGALLKIREGRKKFLGCGNFPKCKNTHSLIVQFKPSSIHSIRANEIISEVGGWKCTRNSTWVVGGYNEDMRKTDCDSNNNTILPILCSDDIF